MNVKKIVKTKICGQCAWRKKAEDFGIRTASNDGLAAMCKDCLKAYDKARNASPKRVKSQLKYAQSNKGKAARQRAQARYMQNKKAVDHV